MDDGPATLEESLAMARIAVKDGITVMIATPHCLDGVYANWRPEIISACSRFNHVLEDHQVALTVLPGSEARLGLAIVDELESGRFMTLNDTGRYISLELPDHLVSEAVISFIGGLKTRGITPIVGHPERNTAFQHNVDLLRELVEAGALVQITGSSLAGDFGPEAFKCCQKLTKQGMVHFMASDAHSATSRPPKLSKAYKKLSSFAGKAQAEKMVFEHPQAIIDGTELEL